jgi:DNA-binding NarL/FixJ family response regulator
MATTCLVLQRPDAAEVTSIAIVEDHGIARAGAEQLISSHGNLRLVASVATVAECATLSPYPDVVVLDLSACHPADSATTVASLAEHSAVLVISRYSDGRDLVSAFQVGARGLVTRDTDPDVFIAAVQAAAAGCLYVAAEATLSVAAEMRRNGRSDKAGLATREAEALRLLAYGYTHSQIARRMGVTEATVNTYVKRIRGKLNAGNKAELTRMAIELGYAVPAGPVAVSAAAGGGGRA